MESKKQCKQTYLQNRSGLTDIENKPMVTKGEGERDKLGVRDLQMHTTTYKMGKQQGFTIYRTGNYIQYLVITYNGREF